LTFNEYSSALWNPKYDENFNLSSSDNLAFPMAGSTNQSLSEACRSRYTVHPKYSQDIAKAFGESEAQIMTKRRHSLQNISHSTLTAPNKCKLNPDIIKKRNMEVMKEIVDYMKKMHEEAVFKKNYGHCIKFLESSRDESNNKSLKKMNTIDGMKRWALLRQQFRKQKQICSSKTSEVTAYN
jgi:hypothetical protein